MSEYEDIEANADNAISTNNVLDMIDALQQGNNVGAQDAFNAEIGDRIASALDAKKIEVAADIYGASDEVSTDVEPEEMEIDAELETDVEVEAEEETTEE